MLKLTSTMTSSTHIPPAVAQFLVVQAQRSFCLRCDGRTPTHLPTADWVTAVKHATRQPDAVSGSIPTTVPPSAPSPPSAARALGVVDSQTPSIPSWKATSARLTTASVSGPTGSSAKTAQACASRPASTRCGGRRLWPGFSWLGRERVGVAGPEHTWRAVNVKWFGNGWSPLRPAEAVNSHGIARHGR